ncbi:Conserved_hypothetical protein [Hexamita inflata]|uniref:Uncharacterized protein n=1 Tax=Hexamita inflata TaxID=28002 RepID=A0AA86NHE7_9EUKA|nr:Conserved hypothetical protein [Hexamita inflata]
MCDIDVQRCNLIFIASGQQISSMIIEPKESVNIQQSFIQFRISSTNSSGLTNVIKQSSVTITLNQCKLSGSNQIYSKNNGYIASKIVVNIFLNISYFDICVDSTTRFGQDSAIVSGFGYESIQCNLCSNLSIVYGLCCEVLKFSENINGMYQCVYPFEYIDNQCICAYGYLLNNTKCINVIDALSNMKYLDNYSNDEQISKLQYMVGNITNILDNVDQSIVSNITEIENNIISNFTKSDYNLLINTSILDNRIYQNITSIQNDILMRQISADTNLLFNTTVLDQRIYNNVSNLQNTINNLTLHLNDLNNYLQKQTYTLELQQNIIQNLTQQLNCTSSYGFSIVNGSCVQISCAVYGQQSINGICQCTIINQIVVGNSCICPQSSRIVRSACICSISGQIMKNGQCTCATSGAFVENNACVCGINSLNISNVCSCPIGSNLVNGVCTCMNINSYVSGNQCVCPTYSILIENTCTCPTYSENINNICTCNQISGQIMNNGCQCQTTGAFVKNGACSCGLYALNVSNQCTCPTNSSLQNNICTCDKIVGQQMINGTCACSSGQSIINDSCQQTSYIINISNFECSQQLFTSKFDIVSTTNQVSTQTNFTAGFVFSATTVIENAFIDISDNVYTTSVQPLFQSQNNYKNLKIQFGIQSLNSGSFILSSSTTISINQMNIISRPGSQLTVNAAKQLNILTSTSTNANITRLLINLQFSPSSGNITLISNISAQFYIYGYQIIGSYVSTGMVTMIGIYINSAAVNVNQVSFQPSVYNVGNASSYLFGITVSHANSIEINNFAIILGSSSNYLLQGSVSSTSYHYRFGGIITSISGAARIKINNVIYDSYQNLNTDYVSNSGFIIGYIQSTSNSIMIENMCMQQSMTSTTKDFYYFGLVGWNYGNISFINAIISFSVLKNAYFECLGIIGLQHTSGMYVDVINLVVTSKFSSNQGEYIGSIFGAEQSTNCSIQNTIIDGGNISSSSKYIGGFSGYFYQNVKIQNATIQKTNISGLNYIGGFAGIQSSTFNLIDSKIQYVRLFGSYIGIISGNNAGTTNFSGSSSTSNYINDSLKSDCAILSNWQNGC